MPFKRDKNAEKLLIHTYTQEQIEIERDRNIIAGLKTAGLIVLIGTMVIVAVLLMTGCSMASELHASYYSMDSLKKEGTYKTSGGIMANGKRFDENALTAAAGKQYPLGTRLLITNKLNNKSVLVTVTDRIGRRFAKSRIDLSRGSFLRIAELKTGLIPIKVYKVNIVTK